MAQAYVGEIRLFAGNFAPAGWMPCEGQEVPISQFDALFNLIGTAYGGDGSNTFRLPDFRKQVPVHAGSGQRVGEHGTATFGLPHNPVEILATASGGTAPKLAAPDRQAGYLVMNFCISLKGVFPPRP